MGVAWFVARADLRHRRRAVVGLALLVTVALVVPITAAAAARRTDSSVDRMRKELEPYHADVQFEGDEPPEDALARIAAIPGVEAAGEGAAILARPRGSDLEFSAAFGQGPLGPEVGAEFERARIREGHPPQAADEVMLSSRVAEQLGVGVGDRIELETLSWDGLESFFGGTGTTYDGPLLPLEVVGVGDQPEALTAGGEGLAVHAPAFVVAETFFGRWAEEVAHFSGIFVVRLIDGPAGGDSFAKLVHREFGGRDDVSVHVTEDHFRIDDAVRAQTLGLMLLAVTAAVAALVAVIQAVARHVRGTFDEELLAATGLDERGRRGARMTGALVPVIAGTAGAMPLGIVASQWFPTGAAGRVEPDPGVAADLWVLGLGAIVTMASALVVAVLVRPTKRRSSRAQRNSRVADRLGRSGLPVAVVAGARSAVQAGSGNRSVPVRSAIVATVAGITGIVAAVVFGASLARLVDSPERYGFNWDLSVGVGDELSDDEALRSAREASADSRVEAALLTRIDNIFLDGHDEYVFATRQVKGDLDFTVVRGRSVEREGEVAVGGSTLDDLDVAVGQTVTARGRDGDDVELIVVGQALFPTVENDDPARGAAMTLETYEHLASQGTGFPDLYLELDDSVSAADVAEEFEQFGFVTQRRAPAIVGNLDGVSSVPYVLAGFLGALALVTVAHTLLVALRRRRHELAVLKTLGFVRRQLATTVLVQAGMFIATGLVLGAVLGLGLGRQAWQLAAGTAGFATDPLVPAWLLFLVPAALATVLVIAAGPARSAAHTRPALALRAE